MKKVIVAGGRDFKDYALLKNTLQNLFKDPVIIVSGCAKGADSMGEQYAYQKDLDVERHPARWNDLSAKPCVVRHNSYGPYNAMAGYNRNREMLDSVLANPDGGCVVAFWDGKSRGTADMIRLSREAGVDVKTVSYAR